MDYLKYYYKEEYLFKDVSNRFKKNGFIDAFDFFCIIIWKAERAKTKIVKKILSKAETDNLDDACRALTSEIFKSNSDEDRLKVLLIDWKFRLPTASAVLTVLYPDRFTIYDIRVCDELEGRDEKGPFHQLKNKSNIDIIYDEYEKFINAVKAKIPDKEVFSLRDKDRFLWGKSFYDELNGDIKNNFKRLKK